MEPNYLVLLGIVIVIIEFALKLDAILIIMASVDDGLAAELEDAACHWGMDALIEVHDRDELDRALRLKSPLIGVNNRNLKDFSVNPVNSLRLRDAIPASKIFVAESGIQCAADVKALKQAGVQAVLVGEALMRSADAAAMLKEMRDA